MSSEAYIRHQMANHMNWSPAIHFQIEGEVENVKHTFELKLSKDTKDFEKEIILGKLQRIFDCYTLGDDYQAFFCFQRKESSKEKDLSLVVATKSGSFVNGITTIYEKNEAAKAKNKFFDIGEHQEKILRPEIVDSGVTYVIAEHGVEKEDMGISGSLDLTDYKNSDLSYIPKHIERFGPNDFSGVER